MSFSSYYRQGTSCHSLTFMRMIKNRNGATTSSISVFFLFPEFNHIHKFIVIRKKLRSLQQKTTSVFCIFLVILNTVVIGTLYL